MPIPSTLVPPIPYLHALILGLVQGATEFLPVSSTAHMDILPRLLGWGDPGAAFSAVVQLGPIVAIIAYFRKDLIRYVAGIGRSLAARQLFPAGDADARLGWYVILATVPIVIAGVLLKPYITTTFRSLYVVSIALIVLGFILAVAERVSRRNVSLESMTLGNALWIGLAQALALVPGTSRSGTTITAGLFAGLDRKSAADFSFLLSIPAIILAGLSEFYSDVLKPHASLKQVAGPYVFSALVAGIAAYVVIKLFLGYLEKERNTTMPFIIYRILLGIAILTLVSMGRLTATSPAQKTGSLPQASPRLTSAMDSADNGTHRGQFP